MKGARTVVSKVPVGKRVLVVHVHISSKLIYLHGFDLIERHVRLLIGEAKKRRPRK